MLSEDDKCFQCQESGHMACHCPNIRCFNCDEYSHVPADCPDKIPLSGMPAHHGKHHSSTRNWTRLLLGIITGTDTGLADPDHICTLTNKEVTVEITHKEVTPGHITDTPTEAHHTTDTQTLIVTNGTHCIEVIPHLEALLHILETAVGLDHILCTKLAEQHLLNLCKL